MVVALVQEDQVAAVERIHRSAGISPAQDYVAAGHDVVRQIAAAGAEDLPPCPPTSPEPRRAASDPGARQASHRPHDRAASRTARPARSPRSRPGARVTRRDRGRGTGLPTGRG
jgi:hypothetical protein